MMLNMWFHVVLCILLCCSSICQQESCIYTMAILQRENVTCFSSMKGKTPCDMKHPNCITEKINGLTCIKWFETDLICVDEDLKPVTIENQTCARDQKSLSCKKEFPITYTATPYSVSNATAGTISWGDCYILLLVLQFLWCKL